MCASARSKVSSTPRDFARRQLLEEGQHARPLHLLAHDDVAFRVNAVNLENRLRYIETDGGDRLHVCLLRFVVTSSATTSLALPRRLEEPSTASATEACDADDRRRKKLGISARRSIAGLALPQTTARWSLGEDMAARDRVRLFDPALARASNTPRKRRRGKPLGLSPQAISRRKYSLYSPRRSVWRWRTRSVLVLAG